MERTKRTTLRWTTLVLLWFWGICMFVVVDLFWDVDGFDRVRPQNDVYRHARLAAHQMVGLAEIREEVHPIASPGPPPPKAFKGTKLEWRIRTRPLTADDLARVPSMKVRDRLAVLRKLHVRPDANVAEPLSHFVDELPSHVPTLANYSAACVATLRALIRDQYRDGIKAARGRTPVVETEVGRRLVEAVFEAQARVVSEHGSTLKSETWVGVADSMVQLRKLFPRGYRAHVDVRDAVTTIDRGLRAELVGATVPKPGFRGGVGAISAAVEFGRPQTLDALIECVAAHDNVRAKLKKPKDQRMARAFGVITEAVATRGSAEQKARLASHLAAALTGIETASLRLRVWHCVRMLALTPGLERAALQQLADASAQGDAERAHRRAVRSIANGKYRGPPRVRTRVR